MRAAIEDHGAVQEELRSAHEEMLSANEEFQSTNEELETSKEELQSTNEELTTTIDELRSRNQELADVNVELDAARRVSDSARSYADIIIETVREPLAVLDGALRILRVNPAFSANLQVPRQEIEGRFLRDVGDGRWNIPDLHEKLRALLTNAQPLEDWEVTLDLAQQGRRVVSLSARRIPGDADRGEQLLLALEDVTARANMTAGLLASDEQKDQFIAMLGHELRHPLTPITHAIYLLRQGNPDPAALELLETIDTQTQTLLRFVNELLDLARIRHGPDRDSAGTSRFRRSRTGRGSSAPAIHRGATARAVARLPAAPMYVNGDSGRLRQVVINLVENAAKYTEPGGRITVTLEQRGDEAVLRVRDSGIGIAAENLERIFEPFTQSHRPLAHPSSGLGIGLSVVRRILELHGGHIRSPAAASTREASSLSRCRWRRQTRRTTPGRENRVRTPTPLVTLRARRVMIVDDHEEIRTSVSRLVRVWGHEVAVAGDGPSALVARGDLPARVRHRGPLIAGDQRDRPGSSSASAVSSGAALSDRSHRLRGRGHPRRVPRRRFRCVSGQARRNRRVGETAGRRPRGFRCGATPAPRVHSTHRRNSQESLTEELFGELACQPQPEGRRLVPVRRFEPLSRFPVGWLPLGVARPCELDALFLPEGGHRVNPRSPASGYPGGKESDREQRQQ